jgi:hypothetical protein
MKRLLKLSSGFCAKKGNYFWTEVNANVKEAEYAVRGVVPTLANTMKLDIQNGKTGKDYVK